MTAKEVLEIFSIDEKDVIAVYPYGSHVYGSATEESDHDWVVVYKSAFLDGGTFKINARSSADGMHQIVQYSRTGFLSAIDTYEMTALECLFLPEGDVLMNKMPNMLKIRKWVKKEMVESVITKASASWYQADQCFMKGNIERSKKNAYHSLRILGFGMQMARDGRITDFSEAKELSREIMSTEDFRPKMYLSKRDELMNELKSI